MRLVGKSDWEPYYDFHCVSRNLLDCDVMIVLSNTDRFRGCCVSFSHSILPRVSLEIPVALASFKLPPMNFRASSQALRRRWALNTMPFVAQVPELKT